MSENPVASIKALARYKPDIVYIGIGEYVDMALADDGDYYLAADVDAAIEALRAEVEEWKRVASAQAELHDEAEARAERLADALRELVDVFSESGMYDDEVFAKARAELEQENRND